MEAIGKGFVYLDNSRRVRFSGELRGDVIISILSF